ncbi:MAG: sulfatase-like hydrolase/transferase [Paludibacter sp.]|nr:sulfatase-like hydrolase/transferase [Bacteroidales bacterium]MCM1068435.1 sulfatase-like hydrolase/transferase [Prevotella sp.]MCM1353390.1 sulfatase-like hydrolase/transferase [Bacteroides sp.]MCM1442551.1 sulfatase-like hydrolase/transferase [Muribaculum sp.]MCM1481396.1 sulfatase-like hydrolase/transferase [Paludibacter sp.]
MMSSLWTHPLTFWSFWLPKVGVALFLASFVFFGKSHWWTVVVALFIDVWMLANTVYSRSNGVVFDGFTFTMAGNMDGYWSSVLALLEWKDIMPFLLTVGYAVGLYILKRYGTIVIAWKTGLLMTFFAIMLNWFSFALVKQFSVDFYHHGIEYKKHSTVYYLHYNPFSYAHRQDLLPMNKDYAFSNFSVLHGFVFVMLDYVHNLREMDCPYELTAYEQAAARALMGTNTEITYDQLLLIIIVESLESWTIDASIMPHLTHFMDTHPVLYAKYLKSQVRGGTSADGQMIINTGLLPIAQGATCFRYPWITFPSITNRADSAVTLLTHSANCWNQTVMGAAYGYDLTLEGTVEDSVLAARMIDYAERGYRTIQGLTIATHMPFAHAHRSRLVLPDDMPAHMRNYLKCLHWTDEGLGVLLERVDSIPQLAGATIVITGDHTVFWKEKREEFSDYCRRTNCAYDVQKGFVPLIVYSPSIAESVCVEDECYQMDIYPTLLSLMGADDYYWRGFGVNVLDATARKQRPITEEDAYILSEKLIRSNWFKQYR